MCSATSSENSSVTSAGHVPPPILAILEDSESLLWCGQPNSDIMWVHGDCLMLLPLTASMIVALTGMIAYDSIAGLFLFLTTAFVIMMRFQLDCVKRRKMWFLVTDRRIAIKNTSLLDQTLRSKYYSSDFIITSFPGPRNTTSLCFGTTSKVSEFLYPSNYYCRTRPPAFVFLDDAEIVKSTIEEAMRKSLVACRMGKAKG